jgi:hypothetical protein
VNFFGHAALAAARQGDPGFVLGAMLPDLAPLAGLRIAAVDAEDVAAGRAFHFAADARFHADPRFVSWAVEAAALLQARGIARGPARGAAHVGVELLLDGWLAESAGVPSLYRRALGDAPALAAGIRFRAGASARPFPELCARLLAAPLPEAYGRPAFVAERVVRILARRPRLALAVREQDAVALALADLLPRLRAEAPVLMDAMERVGDG